MATVSELKAQARTLEQQEAFDKALAIYRHILKHLEGTPALLAELPLYVKVGDLEFKLGRPEPAVESYERAARIYAEHGSAKSVIALCAKIARVTPGRRGVHLPYARTMLERGHVEPARVVLLDYADKAKLGKTLEALNQLTGRAEAEAKPVLEMLLETAARGVDEQTERAAERMSRELRAPAAAPESSTEERVGEEAAPAATPAAEGVRGAYEAPAAESDAAAMDGSAEEERGAAGTTEPPARRISEPEWITSSAPEERREVLVTTPPARRRSPAVVLGAVAAVVAVAGVAIVLVTRSGGGRPEDTTGPAAAPGLGAEPPGERAVSPSMDSVAVSPLGGGDTGAADSAALAVAAPAETTAAVGVPSGTPAPPSSDTAAAGEEREPTMVVVEGLAIEEVMPAELRGQSGFRVVQRLATGGVVTVESYEMPDTARATAIGRINVTVAGDTAVAVVRLARHIVYASAVLPGDSLQQLLRDRLVVRPPAQ